jgi:DNA polymerase
MEALSDGLRGIIVAGPGQQLYVADYANIEARVLFWLAHEETGLDIFRRGEDIYLDMAAKIKRDRQMGKAAILGLGYGMGAEKFAATAGITEAEAQTIVDTYRREYSSVRYLWYNQGDAAMAAVLSKTPKNSGATRWEFIEPFLFCTLPSGRRLAYPFPEVAPAVTWWGEVKDQLTCMGQHAITRQWVRTKLYGGLLVENITQAVARDILAEALLRCEASGVYSPVLSVHDEVLCEAPLGAGSTENYVALLTQPPTWAPDLPIAAQGFSATRYCK